MADKTIIGQTIAELRKASGMTQAELAEKLNVSYRAVSLWERSETMPAIMMIPRLAEIFGVGIGVIFGETAIVPRGGTAPVPVVRTLPTVIEDVDFEEAKESFFQSGERKFIHHSGNFTLRGDLDFDLECDGDVSVVGVVWGSIICGSELTIG